MDEITSHRQYTGINEGGSRIVCDRGIDKIHIVCVNRYYNHNLFIWKSHFGCFIVIIKLDNPFPSFKVIGRQPFPVPKSISIEYFHFSFLTSILIYFAIWKAVSIKMLTFIGGPNDAFLSQTILGHLRFIAACDLCQ